MNAKFDKIIVLNLLDKADPFWPDVWALVYGAVKGTPAYDDPEKACRDAVAEYLGTEDGMREADDNNGSFNWGDAASIPFRFLEKRGFVWLGRSEYDVIDLDHNEGLYDGGTEDKG